MALNGSIENINTKSISDYDLVRISQVEQDMWARDDWLWEYVQCSCCQKIHSKNDIFWHLSNEIRTQNVNKILDLLSWDSIRCNGCWNDTEFLYWPEYIAKIRERYSKSVSYLTVYRDDEWEIRGFIDWYIDNFTTIYQREFLSYYWEVWINLFTDYIKKKLKAEMPKLLMACPSIWIEEKYSNFFTMFELIKFFSNSVDDLYKDVLWISEAIIWTVSHKIYNSIWTIQVWITNSEIDCKTKNNKYVSDVFIHPHIISSYRDKFNLPIRSYLMELKKWKSIVLNA